MSNVNQLEEETSVSKSLLERFDIFIFLVNKFLEPNLPKRNKFSGMKI